jgi:branched-chain amino acid aminotransferase
VSVWLNDRLVDAEHAQVSAFDHGLTVGDGVFTTIKVMAGEPFALTRHLRRLEMSARGLGLPAPDEGRIRDAVAAVLSGVSGSARLRVTYTGGTSPLGSERGTAGPTLVVATAPLPTRDPTTMVATVPWLRNERGALAGLKTTSYGENVIALAAARRHGASEALFANTAGDLCEGTGTNVFVVLDGRLVTPPLSSGCLAGVTRSLVLEWVDTEESAVPMTALDEAEEVFLTSTTRDVQPVHAVDDRSFVAPGPVTAKVMAVFAERAAESPDP